MIQGTMSNAGKSLLVAGLCRILRQDGWKVAPFKSQNMALNSYVTSDGLEMGRAQVMQAEAAGIEPSVLMNPILLKPTSDRKSQVIVNGEVAANMDARDYFEYKKQLVPAIMDAFGRLSAENDIIVIEGAGSPAEINLRENDIVNMGLAEMVDAPVLLVGDIDRGGVFAQLLGTLDLLSESERARVKGLVVNKFRGDVSLLEPGLRELEARGGVPVTGVVPYMKLRLDDEDSLTERFGKRGDSTAAAVTICVVRLPHISNFSDFSVFEQFEGRNGASGGVSLCYVDSASDLKKHSPDMIVLPGSKNTIGD
jgi:adenosylcobyric acid synthase